jgi:pyridoxal phosphate enzyme (YggS family)
MTILINENLAAIKQQIARHEIQYQREPGSVALLAASKNQPLEKIIQAYQSGQTRFGENYLQEAIPKITALRDQSIEWHFIGPIQSNKTRKIAEYFDWVHSVDSLKIAKRLNDQRPTHLSPLNICIEVNISQEPTKAGIEPEAVASLITDCLNLPQLKIRGLMVIPSQQYQFSDQRSIFHTTYQLWQSLRQQGFSLDTLSMGMSGDFEAAIAEGSTLIRLGTAIFGERK